ncbi:hypothetical protein [uncultured Methanobrevibacter sp.]|uniref:hypothetical protein n=1 Tax=uncultured Methanobrevibacter sp. TaxID=253161 RepID=UPI0025EDF95C|nr:hypothetical protein [uncultured Methanobrevibacter sp.]
MNIYKTKKNELQLRRHHRRFKNKRVSLDDMVGKYKAIEPINSVELKHKLK